ncbi:MAG: molybdate ABC transporter substrate-binding protein [Chloroflexi bacterium]|nr:molybdate ABC transporter substrate-binding protein [Chloroflexota bacterium]
MRRLSAAALLLWLLACGGAAEPANRELMVFAAASLSNLFPQVATAFQQQHPGVSVKFNFAGSQRLRTQLEHGARADVFASADQDQMELAMESGLLSGEPVPFASNRMVVIVPQGDRLEDPATRTTVRSLEDLANPGVKLVVALPAVPAGKYALEAIQRLGNAGNGFPSDYSQKVRANVVSQEPNVRGVVQKVVLNEVDAGVVYQTDARVEHVASKVAAIQIPDWANPSASYPIGVLRDAAEPDLAGAFVEFLRSPEGRLILRGHGFGAPKPGDEKRRADVGG